MALWVFVLLYLFIQIGIGYWVSKRVNNQEDYFLAGRSLGPLLATFSIFATWFGAETCIGSSSAVFSGGLSDTRADPFGFSLCLFLMGLLFARKLWSLGVTTIADFYRTRFGGFTEKLAVFVLIPSTLMWAAAQIRAFGQILSIVAPIDPTVAITVAASFVILYTFLGGLLGDVITDVLQGSIVMIGLAVLLYLGIDVSGGIDAAISKVDPARLSLVKPDESWWTRIDAWMVPILGSLMAQELLSRVFASRSAQVAKRSSIYAGVIYLFIGLIPVTLGLIGFDLVTQPEQSDQFLPMLAKELLHPALFVIFVGALVSAILSTVDSTLLSTSAFISHNIFGERYRKMSQSKQLLFSRLTIVFGGLVAYLFALGSESIYDLVVAASAFGAAGTLTITVFGLWFPNFGDQRVSIPVLLVGLVSHPFYEYVLSVEAPFALALITSILAYFSLSMVFTSSRRLGNS